MHERNGFPVSRIGKSLEPCINECSCFSSLSLLRSFYVEGLVDQVTLLVWIVQQMAVCNMAQAGFVTRLAGEYIQGILISRPLCRPFVEACLCKITEAPSSLSFFSSTDQLSQICGTQAQEYLSCTLQILKHLVQVMIISRSASFTVTDDRHQQVCIALPEALISPSMWTVHSVLIIDLLMEVTSREKLSLATEYSCHQVHKLLAANAFDIKKRNEAMLFQSAPPLAPIPAWSAVVSIEVCIFQLTRVIDVVLDTHSSFSTPLVIQQI
jgi:mediator of RNA polymerase II transcription subunit 12, fungi type